MALEGLQRLGPGEGFGVGELGCRGTGRRGRAAIGHGKAGLAIQQRIRVLPVAERQQGPPGLACQVEIRLGAFEVEDPVDILQLPFRLDQVEAQAAGLEVLTAPLEAHAAAGIDAAAAGVKFEPVGQQAAAVQQGLDLARGDEAVEQQVEALLIGLQIQLQGWGLGRGSRT